MKLKFENGEPIMQLKKDDVTVSIAFSKTGRENMKEIIIDFLSLAYEKRLTQNSKQ